MSLVTNVSNLATRVATEFKTIRTLITGSGTGDLSGLTTTAKSSVVAAINEVKASSGTPAAASESAAGVAELATQAETNTGTDDTRIVTPLKLQTRLAAYAQPVDADLTSIAALTTTAFGRGLLTLADSAALRGQVGAASETATGVVELATTAEATTGTDTTRAVTPAGVAAALSALIASAPSTLNTLDELAAALGDDPAFATTITTALGNRVRVDAAQGLTAPQQAQGRSNIDAASATDVGNTATDFVTVFEAALA